MEDVSSTEHPDVLAARQAAEFLKLEKHSSNSSTDKLAAYGD